MHFKQYDYVLLDCPPNLYSTTKSAIFSADSCIVPYVPDYLSLSGFQVLAEQIAEMREKFAPYLPGRRKPNISALIVSHYRQTGNVFRLAVNELELSMAALREKGLLADQAVLLQPFIRHCVRVAESTSEHLPVILYAPGSIGAQDYADLTQQFVDLLREKNELFGPRKQAFQLGERLAKAADKLEGEELGRSAAKVVTQLNRFEEQVENHLASRKSGELMLEGLLRSPASKKHLTLTLLKHGLREICAKRLKSDDLAGAKREFIELIHGAGKQDQGVEFLKAAFAKAAHVESGGKDKALLQREFIHLGRLLDAEFTVEIGSRTLTDSVAWPP